MLFSLSQEASQQPFGSKQQRRTLTLFFKFSTKDGFVKQVLMPERTQFGRAKRLVCSCVGVDPADVCVLFNGRELEPMHRASDVNMQDGAVLVVLERSVVHPPIAIVMAELASQQAARAPEAPPAPARIPENTTPAPAAPTLEPELDDDVPLSTRVRLLKRRRELLSH